MRQRVNPELVAAIRNRVQAAFGELRKVGFITKTNFSCCMTCAVAELDDIAEQRRRNRAVYWHRQDEEHFRKGGVLSVRYCYLPPKGIDARDTTQLVTQIGEQVADALRKAGLNVKWDGDPGKVIEVVGIANSSESGKVVAHAADTAI